METEKTLREREAQAELEQQMNKLNYKQTLQSQMQEKYVSKKRQTVDVVSEKMAVDAQIKRYIQEDLQRIEEAKKKKCVAFGIMQSSLADKERKKQEELERQKEEDRKYQEYILKSEQRNNELAAKRTKLEEGKNQLYEQLRLEKEQKLADQKELENLKVELTPGARIRRGRSGRCGRARNRGRTSCRPRRAAPGSPR